MLSYEGLGGMGWFLGFGFPWKGGRCAKVFGEFAFRWVSFGIVGGEEDWAGVLRRGYGEFMG